MNNTLDSSSYEIIRDESLESVALLSEISDKQVSKINSNELLQVPSQGIKVYLRFKPENDCENKLQDETYSVVSQSTLLTKFPNIVKKSARNVKKLKNRDNSIVSKRIKFTQIFNAEASQEEIFEHSVKSDITNFISGQNFNVLTYGTTNSGKTYTLFGTESEPGIIPRCIDFIFANIHVISSPKFKLINNYKVICCQDKYETEAATKLKHNKEDKKEKKEHISCEVENSTNLKYSGHDCGMIHSIWLSFGEIYNEAVYDLLSEDSAGKDTRLKLVPDKDGTFVKGLKIVHAASALEAHQILTAAISKLRVAASSFNQHSSRSHAVFTIKLLKYYEDSLAEDVKVYTLTFYDLAGSGRLESTLDNEQILIDSKYINKSLLAFNRCMKVVVENHVTKQNNEMVGPFRESCLTRLMQKSLCEKEAFTIFVNLNTTHAFHVETQNILGLVLSLRKVVNINWKQLKKNENEHGLNCISREMSNCDVSSVFIKNMEDNNTNDYNPNEELRRQNEILTKELTALKSSIFERECEIRNEFADMYVKMIKDHDENWRLQMEDIDKEREKLLKMSIRQVEDYYEERIESITRKRKKVESIDYAEANEEHSCNKNCLTTIKSLEDVIKQLREDLEKAVIEKNDCKFTLTIIEKELNVLKNARNSISLLQNTFYLDDSTGQVPEASNSSLSFEIDNSNKLKEVEDEIIKKTIDSIELQKQLQEKDEKLNLLEGNLRQCETVKLNLIEKLMTMEQILIDNNIEFSVSDFSSEIEMNQSHVSSRVFEDSKLSFLYTDIPARDSTKVIARIPKDKFSLLSDGDHCWTTNILLNKSDQSFLSNNSSKNDSGITSEGSKSDGEDKDKITFVHLQDKVKQLKYDYTFLKDMHHAYRSRFTELSNKLDAIKHLMSLMTESATVNEEKLIEYEKQLSIKDEEIKRLKTEKVDFEHNRETSIVADCNFQECSKTMQELNKRLKNYEGNELQISKFIEEYNKKSDFMENRLLNLCTYLEEKNPKYFTEQLPKVDELEKQLTEKNNYIIELNNEILELKKDLDALNDLNERINTLEEKAKKFNEEKQELQERLNEKLQIEVFFETKLKNLSHTIDDWKNEIKFLKQEVGELGDDNKMNKDAAQRLDDEISKSVRKMAAIKEELLMSEEMRVNLERTLENEIGNLRPRLLLSDNNVAYVNSLLEEMERNQLEMNRLKVKLEQQDRDMLLLKENRDMIIEKYKLVIEKLQNGDEISISDDIKVLDYVLHNTDKLESTVTCQSENLESQPQLLKVEVSEESNVIIVNSSDSNDSLNTVTTSNTEIMNNADITDYEKRSSNSCLTQ